MVKHRNKLLIMTVIVVTILFGAIMVVIELQGPSAPSKQPPPAGSTVTTTNVTRPKTSTLPFASSNPIYIQAGYPKITRNTIDPYGPSQVNYTVHLRTENLAYQVGELQAPAKSLDEAIDIAASVAELDPERFSLVRANFSPGAIYNETLTRHSRWYLSFARVYQGFWIWGNAGHDYSSVFVEVEGFNGSVNLISVTS